MKTQELQLRRSTLNRISITQLEPRLHVCVDVNEYGGIDLMSAIGFGEIDIFSPKVTAQQAHANRMEAFNFLTENDLAVWRPIGPEDSEIFATRKLDPEYGLPCD